MQIHSIVAKMLTYHPLTTHPRNRPHADNSQSPIPTELVFPPAVGSGQGTWQEKLSDKSNLDIKLSINHKHCY